MVLSHSGSCSRLALRLMAALFPVHLLAASSTVNHSLAAGACAEPVLSQGQHSAVGVAADVLPFRSRALPRPALGIGLFHKGSRSFGVATVPGGPCSKGAHSVHVHSPNTSAYLRVRELLSLCCVAQFMCTCDDQLSINHTTAWTHTLLFSSNQTSHEDAYEGGRATYSNISPKRVTRRQKYWSSHGVNNTVIAC